jgi:subtilisin family serine protease
MPFPFRTALIASLGLSISSLAAFASPPGGLPEEIRLLVRPKASAGLESESPGPASASSRNLARYPRFNAPVLDSLGRRFSGKPILRMCPWDRKEGTLILRFPRGASSEKALLAAYRASGKFDLVEADGIGRGHGAAGSAGTDPNDPYFNRQYGLKNAGTRQFAGIQSKAGADIKAVEAWDIQSGSDSILVAVLDGGLNVKHPEIASRVWVNAGEIAGNQKDDDGNGFIDDVNGWSFANDRTNEALPGTPDVGDSLGHGTNVAGIIGALGGNGIGLAGVARCRIMPVKGVEQGQLGLLQLVGRGHPLCGRQRRARAEPFPGRRGRQRNLPAHGGGIRPAA